MFSAYNGEQPTPAIERLRLEEALKERPAMVDSDVFAFHYFIIN